MLSTPRLSISTGHPGIRAAPLKPRKVRCLALCTVKGLLQFLEWPQMDVTMEPDLLVKPGAGRLDSRCLNLMIHDESPSYTSKGGIKNVW